MYSIEDYGLSLVSSNATTKTIAENLIDNDFIRYWKENKTYSEIYEDDVITFYLVKDNITEEQNKLLCEYFSFCDSQRSIDYDLAVLAIEHNAVNAIVKKLKTHINSYAERFLLSDIIDYLKAGVYYE